MVSIYLVAFLGGSPLGGLATGWLVTQVGSAPVVLILNGTALTFVALYFLVLRQTLALDTRTSAIPAGLRGPQRSI